jgi:hypothetical protein
MTKVFIDVRFAPPHLICHYGRSVEGIIIKPAGQAARLNSIEEYWEWPEQILPIQLAINHQIYFTLDLKVNQFTRWMG